MWYDLLVETAEEESNRKNEAHDVYFQMFSYNICGCLVVLTSIINIVVFSSSKDFLRNYVIFLAISISDLLNGLAYMIAANGRYYMLQNDQFFQETRANECFYKTPWAFIRVLSSQQPAYLQILIAIERILSLLCFNWYKQNWNFYYDLLLICFSIVLTLLYYPIALFVNYGRNLPDKMCTIITSSGRILGTYHYSMISILYFLSFLILAAIFKIAGLQTVGENEVMTKNKIRKQIVILVIAGISVVFVAFPGILQILNEWDAPNLKEIIVNAAYCTFCLHSAFSFPVYMKFRPEFRRRFFLLFFRQRKNSSGEMIKFTMYTKNGQSSDVNPAIPSARSKSVVAAMSRKRTI